MFLLFLFLVLHALFFLFFFFFNDTATTEIYTLSLQRRSSDLWVASCSSCECVCRSCDRPAMATPTTDRKSTRLNSSHSQISYAVFCLKKKKKYTKHTAPCEYKDHYTCHLSTHRDKSTQRASNI